MVSRNTTTGKVLEQMIFPTLKLGGYKVSQQINIGSRIGGGKYIIDVLAKNRRGSLNKK